MIAAAIVVPVLLGMFFGEAIGVARREKAVWQAVPVRREQ
jgi:hypothetical protein